VNTGIIVQARLNSTRFPKKILKKIYKDYSVIDFLLQRIRKSKLANKFILAVPLANKKKFSLIAKRNNFELFGGSEKNVLKRYYDAATKYKLNTIIRVTSDSPLMNSSILDNAINHFKTIKVDYYNNILKPSYPIGIHIEIFKYKTLKKLFKNVKEKEFKEHVTPYIYNNSNEFRIFTNELKKKLHNYRLTIDYKQDLTLLQKTIRISKKGINVTYQDIISIMKKNPKLVKLNCKFEKRFYIKK
jgi:spore coat polysaccharide biosynthesis protein SpsF